MTGNVDLKQLAAEIRRIYQSDRPQAEPLIEAHLEKRLNVLTANEKLMLLERLAARFDTAGAGSPVHGRLDDEVLPRVFSLLLGRKVFRTDLSSEEQLDRLAKSLNTVFDTLNQLVGVINATFMGQDIGEETIRQVIGFHLEGEDQAKSLEAYLGQVKKAFLVAQEAFKKGAHKKVEEILVELDPERIAGTDSRGLKFGPLRKAGYFETYEQKYRMCKRWFESGRFMEEFLREFEKHAQKLFLQ